MPEFYVVAPGRFGQIDPITSATLEEAVKAAAQRDRVTSGLLAVVPAEAVKLYKVEGVTTLQVTPTTLQEPQ